jgi:hypothetical protein
VVITGGIGGELAGFRTDVVTFFGCLPGWRTVQKLQGEAVLRPHCFRVSFVAGLEGKKRERKTATYGRLFTILLAWD